MGSIVIYLVSRYFREMKKNKLSPVHGFDGISSQGRKAMLERSSFGVVAYFARKLLRLSYQSFHGISYSSSSDSA